MPSSSSRSVPRRDDEDGVGVTRHRSRPDLSGHDVRYCERVADESFASPTWKFPSPVPRPGELVWTLRKDGRTIACELRDGGEYAGVEAQLLRDGEFYAGRRFITRALAVQHATTVRRDLERNRWRLAVG